MSKGYYDDLQQEIPNTMANFLSLVENQTFEGRFIKREKVSDTKFGETVHWYFEVLKEYAYKGKNKDKQEVDRLAKVGEVVVINKKHKNIGKKGELVATRFFIRMKDGNILPGDSIGITQTGKGYDTDYIFNVLEAGPEHQADADAHTQEAHDNAELDEEDLL